MNRRLLPVAIAVFALLAWSSPAPALVAPAPIEQLIDQADLIVVGKITKIEENAFTRKFGDAERSYDAAVLTVSAVLKGSDKTLQVKIPQPGKGGLAISSDRRYAVGQDGVWMLSKDQGEYYAVRHPSAVQPVAQRDKLAAQVKAREELPGGKAVNGLVARAEVQQRGKAVEVRFSLKNTSDKPITVCNYIGNRVLQAKWIGPDGKERDPKHYEFLERARLRPLAETDFVTIQPNGVAFVGPSGPMGGIILPNAEAGDHKVVVSYVSKEDGSKFGLKGVWTGTAASNEVTVTVK